MAKHFKKISPDFPEIPIEKQLAIVKYQIDYWTESIEEQIEYFSAFSESLFKVPNNILLEKNKEIHESINNYLAEGGDCKLDQKIAVITSRIEQVIFINFNQKSCKQL